MPKLDVIKASQLSGWNHIDALLDDGPGWNWLTPTRSTIYYSFSVTAGTDPKSTGVTGALSAFNAAQQAAVVDILRQIKQLTGITFTEIGDGAKADIHFANANIITANNAGLTNWTSSYQYDSKQEIINYVAQAYVYVDNAESGNLYSAPAAGNYAYELLMHELGHAMGLKHPFSGAIVLPASQDNTEFTLMSYKQSSLHSSYGPDDIAALAWLYGGDGLGGNLGVGTQGKYLIATANNDVIQASLGNDQIDGQGGQDLVNFSDPRATYKLSGTPTNLAVLGKEGTDAIRNVERLHFSDMTVNLSVQAIAASVNSLDVQHLEELYIAFFNRIPDADGLAYWIDQFKSGNSLRQIADAFYNAGVAYSSLTGYTKDMSNEAFVNLIYKNVLGRISGADPEGLSYWSNALASAEESHGSLVISILNSAHTYKGDPQFGWVPDLLDNKINVAHMFAVKAGLNYNSDIESVQMGMKIAAEITPTTIDAAIKLIGLNPDQFNLA